MVDAVTKAIQAGCMAGKNTLTALGVRNALSECRYPYCGCKVVPNSIRGALMAWEHERDSQPREAAPERGLDQKNAG